MPLYVSFGDTLAPLGVQATDFASPETFTSFEMLAGVISSQPSVTSNVTV